MLRIGGDGAMSYQDRLSAEFDPGRLEAELHGVKSVLYELEIERSRGTLDIGRYLQLKREYETLKAELQQRQLLTSSKNATREAQCSNLHDTNLTEQIQHSL
jgi:hypothetical protein